MSIDLTELPYDIDEIYDVGLAEVTQSAIGTYLTCKMRFTLQYLLRLRGGGLSIPLLVGTAVHDCFDFLLDPKNNDILYNDKLAECIDRINKMFDVASDGIDLASVANPEKLEHGRAQAHAVVQAWMIVNSDYRERFQVVSTEQVVRAEPDEPATRLGPEYTLAGARRGGPLERRMAGKIDGIVVDYESMSTFILEHKTKYTLKDLNWALGLDLNQQALFYATLYRVWLSRQANVALPVVPDLANPSVISKLPKAKAGLLQVTVKGKKVSLAQPSGLYYDAIAKPYHRSGETQTILIQRMVQAMVEDQSKYFSFTPIELKPETVQHALNNFDRIVKQMDDLEGNNVTFNWQACDQYGGCPYRSICKNLPDPSSPGSILEGESAQLYRIGNLHNELDADMAEDPH